MKFKSKVPTLKVYNPATKKFIKFIDKELITNDKKEIALLKKAKDIEVVKGKDSKDEVTANGNA